MSAAPPTELPSNRSFGITMAVIFGLIGAYPLLGDEAVTMWACVTAGVFAALALLLPQTLTLLNRLWMGFGAVAGRITNPLVLSLVFFLFITPLSLMLKALRKDPLALHLDRKVASYWHTTESAWDKDAMQRQF